MLNSNSSLGLDKVDEDHLVCVPILENIPFGVEQSAKSNVVKELVFEAIGHFVFVELSFNNLVIFEVLW